MNKRVLRFVGCVALAALIGLVGPLGFAWADDDDDDNDDNDNDSGRSRSRGRGMRQLMWVIVKLTGEENWGDVRYFGPASDDDEETSDSDDEF